MKPHNKGLTMEQEYGVDRSDDIKTKMVEAKNGYKHSLETKKKIADAHRGQMMSDELKEATRQRMMGNTLMVGRTLTEETKDKIRQAMIGRFVSQEARDKRSAALKGRIFTPEWRQKLQVKRLGKKLSEEHKRKVGLANRKPKSEHMKQKMREYWGNPENAERQRRAQIEGSKKTPNKPEISMGEILKELYPDDWQFVGDGKVLIENLVPDFINVNGKKLIIEVFGDYWHTMDNRTYGTEEARNVIFNKYGFKMLVVWESELKDVDQVKKDVVAFVEGGKT